MDSTHFHRFKPTTLNPTALEFRPTHPNTYYSYAYHYNFYNSLVPPPPAPVPVQVQLPPPSPSPTRTLLLSSVPSDVSETIIRRDLELFGDVRAVQMEKVRDGLVTVHFYDLRRSTEALHEIQKQHMQQQCRLRKHFDALTLSPEMFFQSYGYNDNSYSLLPLPPPAPGLIGGRAAWAQFTFPVAGELPDGYNQGTLVVFNLDSGDTIGTFKETFEAFGCVKELRGSLEKNQKFVEFYDTRDAAKALNSINGKEINGKRVVVEFSGRGGHKNGPRQNKFNLISSIGPPPVILARKFPLESRPCQPPPPPPTHLLRKTGMKQAHEAGGGAWSKQRKGLRQARNKYDPRYFIKEDGVISESSISDSRTTLMIKNIPNKYSQELLLNMLDSHCIHCNEQITTDCSNEPLSSYDFVYLPIDFVNKCNVGYGFVNMTSPEATMRLYKTFHQQNWEVFNSKKICEVSYARLQGVDALKEHFKNSRFPCEAEYMPAVFAPPRDGRRLTKPTPIVGLSKVTRFDHEFCLTDNECCNSSSNVTFVGDLDSDETNNAGDD